MTNNVVKILAIVGSLAGLAASALSDWTNEKIMEEKIEEKVNEAFAKKNEDDEEA